MSDSPQKTTLHVSKEWDKTFQLISWWKAEDVRNATVMVVGAGALGNEVLKNLALLNVGRILIIDFDTIEYSNLSRSVLFRESDCTGDRYKAEVAAERIREINPNIKVMTIRGDIMLDVGLGVFRRMDVVIGCLDNRLARLFINRHCHKVNKTWVDGAIENLAGQLNVFTPGVSCYECELSDSDWNNIWVKLGCPDIAKRNSAQGRIPTTPISSSIIAAMQVQEALKVIFGNTRQSLAGQRFYYEGMNNIVLQYKSPPLKDECMAHFRYDPIVEASTLSASLTIGEALEWLGEYFETTHPVIELDYEVVLEITTRESEETHELVMPQPHFSDRVADRFRKVPAEDIVITRDTNVLDKDFPFQDMQLRSVGIAPLQILRVRVGQEHHFVELSGDEGYLQFT
ncbi:MAG: ThiF family adenylyltransferase [Bacteroidia bacterium]|nr:ThiF family adenylyltransferase [Bacteroidia bacterium]